MALLDPNIQVGKRLKALRATTTLSQRALGELAGSNQSCIDRYEHGKTVVPYQVLIWYADYFEVSLDYICGRTDDPHGMYYNATPEHAQAQFTSKLQWNDFVEYCFEEGSPMNKRLKAMLLSLADEKEDGK